MTDRYRLDKFSGVELDWTREDVADVTIISDTETGAYVASTVSGDDFLNSAE